MKKIVLTAGLLSGILMGAFGQRKADLDENYTKRKLKFEEANLVTSYYTQDGNRSAVTGGIGTEALTDYAASFDLKVSKYDLKGRQHSLSADFNIDYYTSASSDNIDPLSISGASREDLHIYPSISWNVKNDALKTTQGVTLSYSTEWDYESRGVSFNYAHSLDNDNREITLKGGAFFDTWEVILPSELRTSGGRTGVNATERYKARNSYNIALGISQIINKNLQLMLMIEPAYQHGLLSTPYHRTYFTNGTHTVERLPGTRIKLPASLRASYFMGDKTIFRAFYRFYIDDWGMTAHTANLEVTYKITPFLSVSPFYRYSNQGAVQYFKPAAQHAPTATYYTSDYDIGDFQSNFAGAGFRMAPPGGILGIKNFNSIECRYGYYTRLRSEGAILTAHSVTLAVKMK
jgi:hypothetical protein